MNSRASLLEESTSARQNRFSKLLQRRATNPPPEKAITRYPRRERPAASPARPDVGGSSRQLPPAPFRRKRDSAFLPGALRSRRRVSRESCPVFPDPRQRP